MRGGWDGGGLCKAIDVAVNGEVEIHIEGVQVSKWFNWEKQYEDWSEN